MKKLQVSIPLKMISYIVIPIFALNIIVNSFSILFYESSSETFKKDMTYYETEEFAGSFLSSIYKTIDYYIDMEESLVMTDFVQAETDEEIENAEVIAEIRLKKNNDINYESSKYRNNIYEYLVIDRNGIVFTNIEKTTRNRHIRKVKRLYK